MTSQLFFNGRKYVMVQWSLLIDKLILEICLSWYKEEW